MSVVPFIQSDSLSSSHSFYSLHLTYDSSYFPVSQNKPGSFDQPNHDERIRAFWHLFPNRIIIDEIAESYHIFPI